MGFIFLYHQPAEAPVYKIASDGSMVPENSLSNFIFSPVPGRMVWEPELPEYSVLVKENDIILFYGTFCKDEETFQAIYGYFQVGERTIEHSPNDNITISLKARGQLLLGKYIYELSGSNSFLFHSKSEKELRLSIKGDSKTEHWDYKSLRWIESYKKNYDLFDCGKVRLLKNYFSVSTDYLLGLSEKHTLNTDGLSDLQISHIQTIIDDILQ